MLRNRIWTARWREDVIARDGALQRVRRGQWIGPKSEFPTWRLAQRRFDLLLGVNPDFRVNAYQMAPIAGLQHTAGAEILKQSIPGYR